MMLTWIGYAMLCSAALGGLAACLEYALGRQRYPRRLLWIGVMLASAGLPIGASLLAKQPIAPSRDVAAEATAASGAASRVRAGESLSADRVVLALWAAASVCAGLWLGILQLRLRRQLRRFGHADIGGSSARVSPDFGPAVVGVFHPEIVLPQWALALDDADRRLVVAHETEHTRAHDPALHFAGLAVAVAFPWNAGLWWQLERLRLAIEIDCDARVVARHGHDPIRYGELLMTAHRHAVRPIRAALALIQRRSALGRRIDALVARPRRSAARLLAAGAVGIGSIAAVAFSPAPSLRRPIVVPPVQNTLSRIDSAPTRSVSTASANQTAIAVAKPRVPAAARRRPTITTQPMPPLGVLTPTRFDAELTRVAPPSSPASLPSVNRSGGRGRVGGGGGRGGIMTARPNNRVLSPTPRDSVALRNAAAAVRAVRPDSTRPPS